MHYTNIQWRITRREHFFGSLELGEFFVAPVANTTCIKT